MRAVLQWKRFFDQVTRIAGSYSGLRDSGNLTGAMPVVTDRVAMPEAAGTVEPLQLLEELRKPKHLWGKVPVACHRVSADEEAGLVMKLVSHGMVRLLPESELPRDQHGHLLCGMFFAVPKDSQGRLIFDRRLENSTMDRVVWARLPSGACLTRMLLEPNKYVRGSGVGRRVDPSVVEPCGGSQRTSPNVHACPGDGRHKRL